MVDFQYSNSQFYDANKNFIEGILQGLNEFQFAGWCNAYGYDLIGNYEKDSFKFIVTLKKHQTTKNGIIISPEAHDNSESMIVVDGLDSKIKFRIGNNWLLNLIQWESKILKVIKSIPKHKMDAVNYFIKNNQFSKLIVKKGKLILKTDNSTQNLQELVLNLEGLLVHL